MPQTVTATEAKNRLGALLADVAERQDEVIIESHGRARAAIVPIDAYDELSDWRATRKRKEAIDRLRLLNQEIELANRDSDLTSEETIALADEIAHKAVDHMADRGLVSFERDLGGQHGHDLHNG